MSRFADTDVLAALQRDSTVVPLTCVALWWRRTEKQGGETGRGNSERDAMPASDVSA